MESFSSTASTTPSHPPPSPPSSSSEEGNLVDISEPLHGGDDGENEQVMSEVHLGCPPGLSGPYISHFTIFFPHDVALSRHNDGAALANQVVNFDEDGDLLVPRRKKPHYDSYTVRIQHNITSSIPNVGLQIWRAELVLCDYVLHKVLSSSEFQGVVAVELGAGTGLAGLLLALVANTVYLTDHGDGILDNCSRNVQLNSEIFKCEATVHVRELDWFNCWPPKVNIGEAPFSQRYSWTSRDIEEVENATLLVAADVIYSDDLTDAFFSMLESLMSRGSSKVLYLALEKRYNFSLSDLDVVANGYSHFRSHLKDEDEIERLNCGFVPCFVGKQVDIAQIPQYVREYERGHDVELWKIRYCAPKQDLGPNASID